MPAKIETDLTLLVKLYTALKSIDKVAAEYEAETGVAISRTLVKRRLTKAGFKLLGFPKVDKDRKEKTCPKCERVLKLKRFHKNKARPDGYNDTCRKCWAKYQAEQTLKRKFGMTPDEYDTLLEAQGGGCAICGVTAGMVRIGKQLRLPVDHCHATGRVRGILCDDCNNGLGRFKDDPKLLERAVKYLKR